MRQHCALKHGIFKEFLAEFLGTFVLVVSRKRGFVFTFFYVVALSLKGIFLKVILNFYFLISSKPVFFFFFCLVYLLVVWLRLSCSDRPESKHAGRAANRPHRLLCGPHDGSVRGWWGVR